MLILPFIDALDYFTAILEVWHFLNVFIAAPELDGLNNALQLL